MSQTTVIIGLGVVFYLATCWAVIDIARRDFGGIGKKALWGFITLVPFIGPVAYFAIGIRQGKKPPKP